MLLLCIGPLLPSLDWILVKFFHQPKLLLERKVIIQRGL